MLYCFQLWHTPLDTHWGTHENFFIPHTQIGDYLIPVESSNVTRKASVGKTKVYSSECGTTNERHLEYFLNMQNELQHFWCNFLEYSGLSINMDSEKKHPNTLTVFLAADITKSMLIWIWFSRRCLVLFHTTPLSWPAKGRKLNGHLVDLECIISEWYNAISQLFIHE